MSGARLVIVALALAVEASAAGAQGPPWKPGGKLPRYVGFDPAALHRVVTPRPAPVATVTEHEPNDSIAQATLIVVGDTVAGELKHGSYPEMDVDYFALDLVAGTVVALDVDAFSIGSWIDAVLRLIGPDSVTVVAANDDWDWLDSRIQYLVPKTGRYFIRLKDSWDRGGIGGFYRIAVGLVPLGPGDPTSVFAPVPGGRAIAASADGNLYILAGVSDGSRIDRVTSEGAVSQFAHIGERTAGYAQGMAIDGYHDLLVTVERFAGSFDILRYSPTGRSTSFATQQGFAGVMTVGPDGDVWVAAIRYPPRRYLLLRFSPDGALIDSVAMGWLAADLAFSPAGELHVTHGGSVFRMGARGAEPVITLVRPPDWDLNLAFDQNGYVYVGDPFLSRVHLFGPGYEPLSSPFAVSGLRGVSSIAFGRSADGAMTSRVFIASPFSGTTFELNPAGVRAPGQRIGVDLLRLATLSLRSGVVGTPYADTVRVSNPPSPVRWRISRGALPPGLALDSTSGIVSGVPTGAGDYAFSVVGASGEALGVGTLAIAVSVPAVDEAAAAAQLLGGPPLPDGVQRYLDMQGNNNGRYDVADLRALLRARALLPALVQASSKGRAP